MSNLQRIATVVGAIAITIGVFLCVLVLTSVSVPALVSFAQMHPLMLQGATLVLILFTVFTLILRRRQ